MRVRHSQIHSHWSRRGVGVGPLLIGMWGALLCGCQGAQVANQYVDDFDLAISRLYEEHVLNNLARCDNGEFFVQMEFSNFSSDISRSTSYNAEFTIFDTDDVGNEDVELNVNVFEQSFTPKISGAQTNSMGFRAFPAPKQPTILQAYRDAVDKPCDERFFIVTKSPKIAFKAYRAVRRGTCWYAVTEERKKEFCDFVHSVSFAAFNDSTD